DPAADIFSSDLVGRDDHDPVLPCVGSQLGEEEIDAVAALSGDRDCDELRPEGTQLPPTFREASIVANQAAETEIAKGEDAEIASRREMSRLIDAWRRIVADRQVQLAHARPRAVPAMDKEAQPVASDGDEAIVEAAALLFPLVEWQQESDVVLAAEPGEHRDELAVHRLGEVPIRRWILAAEIGDGGELGQKRKVGAASSRLANIRRRDLAIGERIGTAAR